MLASLLFAALGVACCSASLPTAPANCRGAPTVLSYHVHVVYSFLNKQQVSDALALRDAAQAALKDFTGPTCSGRYDYGRLCFIKDHEFNTTLVGGPFPVGEWSVFVPVPYVGLVSQYFMQHHGEFPYLLHPNTGCEYEDHSIWALWTGVPQPYPLDLPGSGMVQWTQTNEFDASMNSTNNIPCLNKGMTCRSGNPSLANTQALTCCYPAQCNCAPGETCACS